MENFAIIRKVKTGSPLQLAIKYSDKI